MALWLRIEMEAHPWGFGLSATSVALSRLAPVQAQLSLKLGDPRLELLYPRGLFVTQRLWPAEGTLDAVAAIGRLVALTLRHPVGDDVSPFAVPGQHDHLPAVVGLGDVARGEDRDTLSTTALSSSPGTSGGFGELDA